MAGTTGTQCSVLDYVTNCWLFIDLVLMMGNIVFFKNLQLFYYKTYRYFPITLSNVWL